MNVIINITIVIINIMIVIINIMIVIINITFPIVCSIISRKICLSTFIWKQSLE